MNPFAQPSPNDMRRASQRLRRLPARVHVSWALPVSSTDDDEPAPRPKPAPRRAYVPTGKCLVVLEALRNGPMTARQIQDATGFPTRMLMSFMHAPLRHGLVTLDRTRRPNLWSLGAAMSAAEGE